MSRTRAVRLAKTAFSSAESTLPGRSVRNGPGAMQLTVMLCWPISRASARVKPMMAAFEALYATLE
jgi:hypothetical protein